MTNPVSADRSRVTNAEIALPPKAVSVSQDREWCVVEVDGEWKKIRFHDYAEIYGIPGLYEKIFYDVLGCTSPKTVTAMLQRCLKRAQCSCRELRVLDLGAGNGMVGEELSLFGVERIVGVDIIRAAADAALRDRRDVYDDYHVIDMSNITERDMIRLSAYEFNCLSCVAALGFGDIPPEAFINAFNLIAQEGWIAFNIKSAFLSSEARTGFAALIGRMVDDGLMNLEAHEQYPHRRSTSGESLTYTALVGRKIGDVPASWRP